MLRMCLNWKVLGGLALVAAGVWAYRPDLLGSALPLLLLAACPLSMLWMMKSMNQGENAGSTPETANLPNDPDLLRARMSVLAAEQEQVAEHLARLPRPAASTDGGSETSSRNGSV
ncbi:MAG: DUF2933 domain-containing protein [Acidimicrobiia bacterium]